ncbi:hypothetical protein RHMOL_Rhmol04G0036100 [Rhododendron molle]|uniref:Uncharacterized protein n=1 Tax=Rhododendron molle TaxID=49168 RepID=A0ACC0NXU7_RHOML|nr:hypothetical protein RHMOL_Rhmol04G0036100 [Rhododendron molle]
MASQKCISMGFLLLTCLSLSSSHRLLVDSYDPRVQKESKSNLAGGGGSGGSVVITGMGTGVGGGIGYGSGPGWGGGFGGGRGYGVGSGRGGGLGIIGGPWRPPYPGFGQPVHLPKPVPVYVPKPMPVYKPVPVYQPTPVPYYVPTPMPDIGCETCLPVRSCPCPCQGSGGWGELISRSKSAAHLEPELAKSTGTPSVGITGMGTGSIDLQPPYNPYPSVGSCTCPCPGEGGWEKLQSHSKSPAHLEPEFAGRKVIPGGGSNNAANNDPISSIAPKVARSGYGPFEFAKNDGEPAPPDGSATERN